VGKGGRWEQELQISKGERVESSLSERPRSERPRRLADWLNPTGAKKVHSMIPSIRLRR
jgi:hypothetical protein